MTGAFNFFLKIEEFPRISGNSREFLGIPKIFGNSRGDFLNFGKNKKKNVVAPKSGKKSCGGATVTYIFFWPKVTFRVGRCALLVQDVFLLSDL